MNNLDLYLSCCMQDWTTLMDGRVLFWYYDLEEMVDKVAVLG